MACIYRICIPEDNNKSYIGYTKNTIQTRFKKHVWYSNHPEYKTHHKDLHKAIAKFGKDSCILSILFESDIIDSKYICDVLEPFYIRVWNTFGPDSNGYNMTKGGGTYPECTEEIREKLRISGRKLDNSKLRNTYEITFQDGHIEIITGIEKFCKERGYNHRHLNYIECGERKRHKDIVGVKLLIKRQSNQFI